MRVQIHAEHPEPHKIGRAVEILARGGLIAYPTDTVYGLGCDAFQKKALDRLYAVKRMPRDQQLALLVPDLSNIAIYAVVEDLHYRIMRQLVPGPYTFILPASREAPKMLQTKRRTIGIRVPDHAVPLALLEALGRPIISTSATWERETLFDPDEIDDRFALDMVLDGGSCGTEPSTVVSLVGDNPEVVRVGKGPVDAVLGHRPSVLPVMGE